MSTRQPYLKTLVFWSILLLTYVVTLYLPESEPFWKTILITTALIYLATNRKKFQQPIIEDPVSHVRFDGEFIFIGDHSIKRSEIRKVAIDSVKDRGYFSLPYNQISPGEIPEFIFPSSKFTSFRAHLQKEFDTNVEFIT
ncbi:hypothetical protein ACJJIX_09525 [Microbulbifer sp. VAAC004]|uniref:hypothetical protein n=1 Tax=unclassified Microbulbifer TaxID=2619833 RepID=UPI004039A772